MIFDDDKQQPANVMSNFHTESSAAAIKKANSLMQNFNLKKITWHTFLKIMGFLRFRQLNNWGLKTIICHRQKVLAR